MARVGEVQVIVYVGLPGKDPQAVGTMMVPVEVTQNGEHFEVRVGYDIA